MRFFFLFLLMTATVTADLTGEEEEGECGGELTESQGSVESPGYPQSAEEEGARYPDNADCHWTLAGGEKTLVRVKIYDIAIELGEGGSNSTCEFDSLDIELGSKGRKSFCGGRPPEEEIRGFGQLDIYFRSDSRTGYRGFKIYYLKIDNYEPCIKYPCSNNSDCALNDVYAPVCNCHDGFEGNFCQTNIDDCTEAPCQNNGTCVDGVQNYECACTLLYEGKNCDIEKDDLCLPNPCTNQGACVQTDDGITCDCPDGYDGELCERLTGCGDPGGIPELEPGRRFNFFTLLNFTCVGSDDDDDGGEYDLIGSDFIVCQADGRWNDIPPVCQLRVNEDDDSGEDDFFKEMQWVYAVLVFGSLFLLTLALFVIWIRIKRPWGSPVHDLKDYESDSSSAG